MRFKKAYEVWTEGQLTPEEEARLGLCTRTFRRYIDRYEESGMDGLLDKRLTQALSRRVPVDEATSACPSVRKTLPMLEHETLRPL